MLTNILIWAVIGLVVGFIASFLMGDRGIGVIWCIILGIAGVILGGWIAGMIGIEAYGFVGQVAVGVVGACILIFIVGKLKG